VYLNKVRNVCQALPRTIDYIGRHGQREQSRAGEVLVAPTPMITMTEKPCERVLFSTIRDANPFFHLAEAIWMLAGRSDAIFLLPFVKQFKEYAETNGNVHDAYGRRWRSGFGFDQLDAVVQKLITNKYDRQAVIAMWDPRPGYHDDLLGRWRSRPCNTTIFLRVNENNLDLTVACRSNDMLWGCHGSNAVHFSILQEYLAARIDTGIGTMYQLSNNAHIYLDKLEEVSRRIPSDSYDSIIYALTDDRYTERWVRSLPMFIEPDSIDNDIETFMINLERGDLHMKDYDNSWFYDVLSLAFMAHSQFKSKRYDVAINLAKQIAAEDWSIAMTEWIQRRAK
jgi:thymidylate synthase